MKQAFFWLVGFVLSVFVASSAHAEQDNFGRYVLTDWDGHTATYTLVDSFFIKGISEVESRDSDFHISSTGDAGDIGGGGGDCCFQIQGSAEHGMPMANRAASRATRRHQGDSLNTTMSTNDPEDLILESIQIHGIGFPERDELYSWSESPVGTGDSGYIGAEVPTAGAPLSGIVPCLPGSIAEALKDLMKELWEQSEVDDDVPMEAGGIFVPDGQGGWDPFMIFGSGMCEVTPPPQSEWPTTIPSGAIFIHTHPYAPGEQTAGCGGAYEHGPSKADRENLAWFRKVYNTSDIKGIVIDAMFIYDFEPDKDDDHGTHRRCGY
jgi:hypothetical protein